MAIANMVCRQRRWGRRTALDLGARSLLHSRVKDAAERSVGLLRRVGAGLGGDTWRVGAIVHVRSEFAVVSIGMTQVVVPEVGLMWGSAGRHLGRFSENET